MSSVTENIRSAFIYSKVSIFKAEHYICTYIMWLCVSLMLCYHSLIYQLCGYQLSSRNQPYSCTGIHSSAVSFLYSQPTENLYLPSQFLLSFTLLNILLLTGQMTGMAKWSELNGMNVEYFISAYNLTIDVDQTNTDRWSGVKPQSRLIPHHYSDGFHIIPVSNVCWTIRPCLTPTDHLHLSTLQVLRNENSGVQDEMNCHSSSSTNI